MRPTLHAHLLLLVGVFACATSVILIKSSSLNAAILSALRLLVSAVLLSPLYWNAKRRFGVQTRTSFRHAAPGAALLSLHLFAWAAAARMTTSANATLIVNLVPVAMPFILLVTTGERITRAEILGTVVAISGVFILAMKGFHPDPATALGDLLCFVSMLLFACYLAVARHHRAIAARSSLWLYVVPLYWLAGFCCLAISLSISPRQTLALPRREWLIVLALAGIPTIVGHSTLNYAMQTLRGQTVSIFNLAQFIFAGVLGYALFREVPSLRFYIASALVVIGAAVILLAAPSTAPAELPDH